MDVCVADHISDDLCELILVVTGKSTIEISLIGEGRILEVDADCTVVFIFAMTQIPQPVVQPGALLQKNMRDPPSV